MNNLKKVREEKKVFQKELATYLQVTRSAISNWELEKTQIDYNNLIKIADYFDVSIDYILGRKERKDNDLSLTGKEIDLMKMYRELNELFQAQVIGFVKSLIMQQNMNVIPQKK